MPTHTYIISYSRQSSAAFARRLAIDLKNRHYTVWLDVLDIRPGVPWDAAVQQALETADSMVIILSKDSVASKNVMDEVSYMLNRGKTVIPILAENCAIPFRLDRIQYVDFRNNYEQALKDLLYTLREGPIVRETGFSHFLPAKRRPIVRYILVGVIILIVMLVLGQSICSPRSNYRPMHGGGERPAGNHPAPHGGRR
jgi:TIR domain